MTAEQKEQKNIIIQDFRYGIIAELANPYLKRGKLKELIKEKASREYEIPFSSKTQISGSCIKKWLNQFIGFLCNLNGARLCGLFHPCCEINSIS